jgi:hypothetical protein
VNWNDRHGGQRQVPSGGEATDFDAAVVIMADERELMNARIAALEAGVDRVYRQLIDACADLMVAFGQIDVGVVASVKDYVDEVEAVIERVSTVDVAEI